MLYIFSSSCVGCINIYKWMSVFFPRSEKFSAIIYSNKCLLLSLILSPFSGVPIMWMWVRLMLSFKSLKWSSLFSFCFLSAVLCCSSWVISTVLSLNSLIYLDCCWTPLVCFSVSSLGLWCLSLVLSYIFYLVFFFLIFNF